MRLLPIVRAAAGASVVSVILSVCAAGGGGSAAPDRSAVPSGEPEFRGSGTVLESPDHGPHLCWYLLESLPPQCSGIPLVGWDWDAVEGEESVRGTTWLDVSVEGTYDGERLTLTAPPGPPESKEDPLRLDPACDEPEALDPSAGVDDTQGGLPGSAQLPELVALWVNEPPHPSEPLSYAMEDRWDGPYLVNLAVRPGASVKAKEVLRRTWSGHACIVEWDQPTMAELDEIRARVPDVLTDDNFLGANPDYRRGVVVANVIVARDEDREAVDEAFGPGVVGFEPVLTPVE